MEHSDEAIVGGRPCEGSHAFELPLGADVWHKQQATGIAVAVYVEIFNAQSQGAARFGKPPPRRREKQRGSRHRIDSYILTDAVPVMTQDPHPHAA